MPPIQADFSRTNGFTSYGVPPYATMTYNPYTMPPQSSGYSYGAMPNHGYSQQTPYTQPNHAPQMPNSSSANVQRPNDSYFNQILEKYKKDLAVMFKESFGVELKDKTLVCQNSYPESFDSIQYPQNFNVPEFIKFTGEDSRTTWEYVSQFNAQMRIYGSLDHLKIRMFSLSLSGTAFSWFSALAPNSVQT